MKYNAFISYRHAPLDMEIAKKVHTGLETYKIPASVKKRLGIKKINRVFRDQEELPIGSNLSDNINEALESSEFIIVICSPRTPESEWVKKEIETFISLHGRDHVLAVLIEGEPDESFPESLRTDEKGDPVEPLAADVRGATAKERNKKFKTEILRLVAPIIGCTYDDLRQRHRERIIRRTISLVSAAALVIALAGAAFGIYNANVADRMSRLAAEKAQLADEKSQLADEKTQLAEEKTRLADEILKEFRLKQENQSRFFAEESLSLLKAGEREDAALVAMAGLPSEGNDRPYVPEAEYALSEALHAYDTGSAMSFDKVLDHDFTVYSQKLSAGSKYLVTRDSGYNTYLWDTDTWELVLKVTPKIKENNYLESITDAIADDESLYTVKDSSLTKYDLSGNIVFEYSPEGYIHAVEVSNTKHELYVLAGNTLIVADSKTGEEKAKADLPSELRFSGTPILSNDEGYILSSGSIKDSDQQFLTAFSFGEGSFVTAKVTEEYIMDLCYTGTGKAAVLSCNADFVSNGLDRICLDLVDLKTGKILWTKEIPISVRSVVTFASAIKAHAYESDEETRSEIIVTVEAEAFTYDEYTGALVAKLTLGGDCVSLFLRSDNQIGFVAYENGKIDTVDFHEGRFYSDNIIDTDKIIRRINIMNGKIAVGAMRSSSVYIMKYNVAKDMEEVGKYNFYPSIAQNHNGGNFYLLKRGSEGYSLCDRDGKQVLDFEIDSGYPILSGFTDKEAVLFSYETMYIADYENRTVKTVPYTDLGIERRMFDGYLSENGRYAVLWDSRNFTAIDVSAGQAIFKGSTSSGIGNALISEDGKTLFIAATGVNLSTVDVATGEVKIFESDLLRETSDVYSQYFAAVSHDGKTVAMSCSDGNLRIVDAVSGAILDEIPFNARLQCGLYFSPKDDCLILQGDDYKLRIRDLEKKEYIGSVDCLYKIDRPVFGSKGFMAVSDSGYMYILKQEGYGLCARIDGGECFFEDDGTILLSGASRLYRTYYKDYTELMEEARLQFPGAKLSEEKKVKYNIN
ncbi:MAG: TIR domain-containing protein [Lachnospiraceae bacterium]|nr:TIR domain-containing protein [Lachnospiraceae bacterium]